MPAFKSSRHDMATFPPLCDLGRKPEWQRVCESCPQHPQPYQYTHTKFSNYSGYLNSYPLPLQSYCAGLRTTRTPSGWLSYRRSKVRPIGSHAWSTSMRSPDSNRVTWISAGSSSSRIRVAARVPRGPLAKYSYSATFDLTDSRRLAVARTQGGAAATRSRSR